MKDFTKILFKVFIVSLITLGVSLLMSFDVFHNIMVTASSIVLLFCLFCIFITSAGDFDTKHFDENIANMLYIEQGTL